MGANLQVHTIRKISMSLPEVPAAPRQPPTPPLAHTANQPTVTQTAPAPESLADSYDGRLDAQQYPEAPPQLSPKQRPPRKQLWIGLGAGFAAGVLASVLVAGIGAALGAVTESQALRKAVEDCGAADMDGVSVVDKGAGLTIDTEGEDDSSGASMVATACILESLEVPESVVAQMDATTAMQGRQTAAWKNVEASWTYHPDTGVKVIITNAK